MADALMTMGTTLAAAALVAAWSDHPPTRAENFRPRRHDLSRRGEPPKHNPAGTKLGKRLKAGKKLWRV